MKVPEKKDKTTNKQVADFLTTTGFILEMEVGELLKKLGYKLQVNHYFYDYDEEKKREIDIVASKEVNDVTLHLIIECKQNASLDWIFVCSDKSPQRYYNFVKYFPQPPYKTSVDKTGVFDELRQLDSGLPLAQNFIIRHVSGKTHDSGEIYECVKKLPKALVSTAYNLEEKKEKRHILIPLAIFSGQIFTAKYQEKLIINEVDSVQYRSDLDSEAYRYHYSSLNYALVSGSEEEKIKNSPVARISRELGPNYLIEFISQKGLSNFLKDTETRVSKLDLSLWTIEKE